MADGYVSDSTIAAQIGVLNSVYNAVGFEFSLAGVDRTQNADWFNNLSSQTQEEAAMTSALHRGNASMVLTTLPSSSALHAQQLPKGMPLHLVPALAHHGVRTMTAMERPRGSVPLNHGRHSVGGCRVCCCHLLRTHLHASQLNIYTARMASPSAGSTLLGYRWVCTRE